MTLDEALDKVQKLLNQTVANGATAEEEATAAGLAQSIMMKYNIHAAMLNKQEAKAVGEHAAVGGSGSARYQWQRSLMEGIANVNFCRVWGQRVRKGGEHSQVTRGHDAGTIEYTIIGRDEDAALTSYLFAYLFRTIKQRGLADMKATLGYTWKDSWLQDYGNAAVEAVVSRLREQRRRDEADLASETADASTALVVVRDADVDDYVYMKRYGMTKAAWEAKTRADSDAWDAGYSLGRDGRDVDMLLVDSLASESAKQNYMSAFSYAHELWEQDQKPQRRSGPGSRGGRGYQYKGRPERKYHDDAAYMGRETGRTVDIRPAIKGGKSKDALGG